MRVGVGTVLCTVLRHYYYLYCLEKNIIKCRVFLRTDYEALVVSENSRKNVDRQPIYIYIYKVLAEYDLALLLSRTTFFFNSLCTLAMV